MSSKKMSSRKKDNCASNKYAEPILHYNRPGHFSSMKAMQEKGELCDFTIEVGDRKWRAHKVVLSATLKYFDRMFRGNFKECSNNVIRMSSIKAESMESFLNFAYTGRIYLTEDNVQDIFEDANFLGITDIVEASTKYLESNIPVEKAFQTYRFAEKFDCESIMKKLSLKVSQQFEKACKSDEFFQYSFEFMQNVLSNQAIRDNPQEAVFEGLMQWIVHDIIERKIYANDLLKYVLLYKLQENYLTDFFQRGDMAIIVNEHSELMSNIMAKFHESTKIETHFLAISGGNLNEIEIYDTNHDEWEILNTNVSGLYQLFSCGVVENDLYTIGGYCNGEVTADALVYIPREKLWKKIPSMQFKRCLSAVAGLNGCLYVCGGNDGDGLNIVERYLKYNNTWETLKPMFIRRTSAAAVAHDNYIYVIGGIINGQYLNSVERYDPRTNQWTLMKSKMIEKRSGCAAAVLNGMIYVCGGGNGGDFLASTEVYDIAEDKWMTRANMNESRHTHLLISHKDKLWAIGDSSQDEVFDPIENKWIICDWMRSPSKQSKIDGGAISI